VRDSIGTPRGFIIPAALLFFGAAMAMLAGFTLTWPGTFLDRAWRLNPRGYTQMAPLGATLGVPFLLFAVVLAVAGWGWMRKCYWGWTLALIIFSVQVIGDLANLAAGDYVRGIAGVVIAGAFLTFVLSRRVRSVFKRNRALRAAD
jgi:hypothetical protein